jgi:hypothetical protein
MMEEDKKMISKRKLATYMILMGFLAAVLVQPVFAGQRTVKLTVPGCV